MKRTSVKKEKPTRVGSGNIPPEPAQDPRFGDLTPEWIAWYRATRTPEEFAARYAHRGIK
ncbi:hypothetical protein TSACC_2734 [Terrimicrobium sacchariphilum]|uniref:Uncharacterized protein n=1 Tax=Terrimicrobium sacchariphilum TaxID=690879 RepID=A0A146G6K5_TERSA|nr:hypothetical protein [Terrimicrobium sacchariphilum]GAT32336.1 hypothetical protein TSACC_2734 [Terrimicrobium sacchariphilum]